MFCKDEGPEDEEGNGLVIGIWQWLITEADVMFLRLDWKLARIPCGLNGHWALSWKGEETQRGPHRMATGFVNNHTPQLAPVTAALTTTLDWTVTGNRTGLPDNRQLWLDWEARTLPKANLAWKQILSTVCCQSTHDHVLNPRKPLHLRSMLCKQRWSERVQSFCQCLPHDRINRQPTAVASKGEQTGFDEISYQVLPQDQTHLSLTNMPAELLAGYILHSQQNAENTFQDFVKLWSIQFCYSNKQIYFLLTKNCTDYNDPYLISLSLVTVA